MDIQHKLIFGRDGYAERGEIRRRKQIEFDHTPAGYNMVLSLSFTEDQMINVNTLGYEIESEIGWEAFDRDYVNFVPDTISPFQSRMAL